MARLSVNASTTEVKDDANQNENPYLRLSYEKEINSSNHTLPEN